MAKTQVEHRDNEQVEQRARHQTTHDDNCHRAHNFVTGNVTQQDKGRQGQSRRNRRRQDRTTALASAAADQVDAKGLFCFLFKMMEMFDQRKGIAHSNRQYG